MQLDYTHAQRELAYQLREYFTELMTPALEEEISLLESSGPLARAALAKMGRDGWLGIGWPREFGGQGRSAIEQFIFFDEVQRAGFPIPLLTLNTVGPTLMQHGTDAQRREFLPRILAGELQFAIGYTEPHAGTDLAALSTRAVRDGAEYVINGQKVFTSLADQADYIWLAVRTDAEARHRGISILIVDRAAPGVSMQPLRTLGDNRVFTVFYDDVRVPVARRVGAENAGWGLITTQLNYERVSLFTAGIVERLFDETLAWAKSASTPEGSRVIDQPWVQANLARVRAGVDVLRLFNWRQCWNMDTGGLTAHEASSVKVYGSELYVEATRLLREVLADAGNLQRGSPGALLQGRLERYHRSTLVLTFGGGANEIQRDIIATSGLGLPRATR
jgi:alkylation response protein AidB-like acyl-CoA dehydrogenase